MPVNILWKDLPTVSPQTPIWRKQERGGAMAAAAAREQPRERTGRTLTFQGGVIESVISSGPAFVNAISTMPINLTKPAPIWRQAAKKRFEQRNFQNQREFVDGEMEVQPTIRPVLDLSEVRSGAGRLTAILEQKPGDEDQFFDEPGNNRGEIQNGDGTPSVGNSYSFVQNNYSPKALSRIDIYRQTKNQFSALKGLVET